MTDPVYQYISSD